MTESSQTSARQPGRGPYESETEARVSVQHILSSPPGTGAWGDGNRQLLEDACRAAGVQLGAFDYRIILWLAGWEPTTVAVIAGLITRAAAAGQNALPPRYESTIGQAFRDGIRWCEAQRTEDLAEQARFYRSIARELGIAVDPR